MFHRHHVATAVLLALALMSYGWAAKSQSNSARDSQETNPAAQAAAKDKWQEGEACVKSNAPASCPSENRGKCRTGRADGCDHGACTTAKNNARANLRAVVPQACYAYIESTSRCKNGPGCRSAKSKGSDKK